MMHLIFIAATVAIALAIRVGLAPYCQRRSWWLGCLVVFTAPPLLLLSTAAAIIIMGPRGHAMGTLEGWSSYGIAWATLAAALGSLVSLLAQAWHTLRYIRRQPHRLLLQTPSRLLDTPALYSAQVGLWTPELVVTQGLIDGLDTRHLQAVLAHEQAHRYYRDTFWFFWLGWLQRLSFFLPYSSQLWQELLLLRELRADRWAAARVDPLTLAEALVQVVSAPLAPNFSAGIGGSEQSSRLLRRIDALLAEPAEPQSPGRTLIGVTWGYVTSAAWGLLPLCSIPFHS